MKLILEIETMDSHATANTESDTKWVRLSGTDHRGNIAYAKAFGFTAEAIVRKINELLMPGEIVANRSFMVDLTGEWKNETNSRSGRSYRNFFIDSFDILMGHNLELAKIRKDGAERIARSEQYRQEGKLELAYRELAEFASKITGKVIDLNAIPDPDDIEFGASEVEASTPEAAAAARFRAIDRTEDKMEIEAPEVSTEKPDSSIERDADDTTLVFPSSEEEITHQEEDEASLSEENEGINEMDGQDVNDDEPERDVLDDEPVASTASTPSPAPAPAPRKPTFGRPFGFPRPGA